MGTGTYVTIIGPCLIWNAWRKHSARFAGATAPTSFLPPLSGI